MSITIERYPAATKTSRRASGSLRIPRQLLDYYIDLGVVRVALTAADEVIGRLQAVPRQEDVWEVTNTAIADTHRGSGTA